MTTCNVKCVKCGEDSLVTAKVEPNFCSLCGSKEIVINGVDYANLGGGMTVVSTPPEEAVEKCEFVRVKMPVNEDGTAQRLERQQEPVVCEAPELHLGFNCGPAEDWGKGTRFDYEVTDAPIQGTDEWLAWRKDGITATEAAAIMFPDQYGSPLKVYTDKLGLTQNDQSDENGFFEWGHIIEDDLVKKFQAEHPEAKYVFQGRLYQRMWAKCSLDAQCFIGETPVILECKTSQSLSKWNPYPDRYFAQVQWQMYVTGIRKAIIVALVSENGWHYIEREVEYSPKFVEEMLYKCLAVHKCVLNRTPPATLGDFTSDKKAIAAIAGETGHSGENATTDKESYEKFMELKEKAEKATQEFEDFKNTLAYKMMDAPRMTCEGKTFCSWVERKGSTKIDSKKLKELYPEAYEACMTEGLPSRYLKFNKLNFGN